MFGYNLFKLFLLLKNDNKENIKITFGSFFMFLTKHGKQENTKFK